MNLKSGNKDVDFLKDETLFKEGTMEMIWINRTKINKNNWLKLKQIADIKRTTREELINKLVDIWLKNVDIKVGMKNE